MEKYEIDGTPKTPTILFDINGGVLDIKGRSIPENSIEFYKPLVDALDKYSVATKSATTVNIQLEYFNTSSSKCILDIFKKLNPLEIDKRNWYKALILKSIAMPVSCSIETGFLFQINPNGKGMLKINKLMYSK